MLNGKKALITGSTAGIGLGIAESLAKAGCDIMVNGRSSQSDAAETLEHLKALAKGKVFYCSADLSTCAGVEVLIAETEMEFGGVDILVNNAGVQHVAPLEDFAPEKWDLVLALNLSAAFHATRLVLPYMKQKNWGRIINVASAHGHVASAQKSAYVAAKHGLVGLTKVTGLETAETGITANALCPGWVRTRLVEEQIEARADRSGLSVEEEAIALLSEKQPSKTFTTPEQLGEACVFLCSDAASQMTGTSLNMDGGWTAQ